MIFGKTPKVSLAEARSCGLKYYWPDKPCANGHHHYRRVNGSRCLICETDARAERFKKEYGPNKMIDIDNILESKRARKEQSYGC